MCFYKSFDILPIPGTARLYMYTIEELRQIGNHTQQNARHKILPLGTIKQVHKLRINRNKYQMAIEKSTNKMELIIKI